MKTRRFSQKILFMLGLVLLTTTTLLANAGMGLLDPGLIHLVFGNIIIGLVEAFFVRKVFKVKANYAVIILGNYVSTFAGLVLIVLGEAGGIISGTEYSKDVLIALPVLFVVSVVVEWPFFVWSAKRGTLSFSKTSFKYTFFAQCVSYAMLVPFYIGYRQGPFRSTSFLADDLVNLSASACQYRVRFRDIGGGGGSYRGFSIRKLLSATEEARYEAITSRDSIVFIAKDTASGKRLMRVVLDSTGKLHSWDYAYKPSEISSSAYIVSSITYRAELAYRYRLRPLMRPGKASYAAYSIPEKMAVNHSWRWSATVSEDSILFVAKDTVSSRTLLSVVLDSAYNLHSWEYTFEPGDDSFDNYVNSDIKDLAGLAHKYRRRPPSQGGGGGSYDGFTIPANLSGTKYRRCAADVSKDSIIFELLDIQGTRPIETVVLDSTGTLHTCKWKLEIPWNQSQPD